MTKQGEFDGGGHGHGGPRRPYMENGVLVWLEPHDPRLGRAAAAGQGLRLNETRPLAGGPLSQENINFLRERGVAQQYLGMRHTTDRQGRLDNATLYQVASPGFYGDAYSLVPNTMPAQPGFINRQPGFAGSDQEFNLAVMSGINHSIARDLQAHGGQSIATASNAMAGEVEFAIANMGRPPGSRQDATYAGSTPSFGKTHVGPERVHGQIGAQSAQLQGDLQRRGLEPGQAIDNEDMHKRVAAGMAQTFGQNINHVLDDLRTAAPNAEQRRQRMAAAAEARILQLQNRSRPHRQLTGQPGFSGNSSEMYNQVSDRITATFGDMDDTWLEKLNAEIRLQDRRDLMAAATELRILQAQNRGCPHRRQANQPRVDELVETLRAPR